MRTFAGILPQSSLTMRVLQTKNSSGNPPTQTGTSDSFEDVLQQQGSGTSPAPALKGKEPIPAILTPSQASPKQATPSAPTFARTAEAAPSEPAAPSSQANPPGKSKTAPLSSGSNLTAMIVRATIQASAAPKTSVSITPSDSATTATAAPEKYAGDPAKATSEKNSATPDLSTMVAQATILSANTAKAVASGTLAAAKPDKNSSAGKAPAKNQGDALPAVAQSILISPSTAPTGNAQPNLVSIPSANSGRGNLSSAISSATTPAAKNSETSPASVAKLSADSTAETVFAIGNQIPLPAPGVPATCTPHTEKKSTPASAKGSFLQPNGTPPTIASSLSGILGTSTATSSESIGEQSVTPTAESKNVSSIGLSANGTSTSGTANVEQQAAMNATLNNPAIYSSYGASVPDHQRPAEMNILLSSNNDFHDALTQVMHVAQLTQTNESRTPMRVEMEIQTPPGAIVNVYVSRQNDQWRAQLSTNDPQALSWVQDQMSSLRQSNTFGMEVRWLPPQMEGSASHNADLSWDRGGQGQAGYQQPDDRSQSQRQKKASDASAPAAIRPSQFINTLTALGRAA